MVSRRGLQQGVTYLALLLAIAMVSAVLAATSSIVSQAQRREREKQLLWAGEQFRRALLSYAKSGDGRFPRKLEDLLEDARGPVKRRHIRRIYEDPMTRGTDWGLLRNTQGGIVGVYSRATDAPLKTGQFIELYRSFAEARRYADWKFSATELLPIAAGAPAAAASAAEANDVLGRRAKRPARGASAPAAAASASEGVNPIPPGSADPQPAPPPEPTPDPPVEPPVPDTPVQPEQFVPDTGSGTPPQ